EDERDKNSRGFNKKSYGFKSPSSNPRNDEDEFKTLPPKPQDDDKDSLSLTPNKRKMSDKKVIQYLSAMKQSLEANKCLSIFVIVLQNSGDNFKSKIMQKIEDNLKPNLVPDFSYNMVDIFPNLSRKIRERKYIIQNISSLFKFYEVTFGNIYFDWIESHSPASKLTKSPTNSGIVKVDARGVRLFDNKEIFHVEVSGPPSPPSDNNAVNNTKKSLHTDILNLIAILLDHLRVPVENATEIKVFKYCMTLYSLNMLNDGTFLTSELYSTLLPFSLDAISKYKGILYLMAIFHEEIMKQISIMKNLDLIVDHNGRNIVRDVLKIPKSLKDLLLEYGK
ncbi:5828_t:CDS:2, partial [Entrophospora sp. SA101]